MTQLKTQDARKIFEALWARVVEAPADPERHEKFISFVAASNLAKYGVERYREAEAQGIVSCADADRYRKTLAERAAAIVFFRAPQEDPKQGGLLGKYALYLTLSGVGGLVIGLVSGTTVWPGVLLAVVGLVGYVARAVR